MTEGILSLLVNRELSRRCAKNGLIYDISPEELDLRKREIEGRLRHLAIKESRRAKIKKAKWARY